MFDAYKDRTLVQMKIHANQQRVEIDRLRIAINAMMEAEADSDGNAVQTIGKTALGSAES